MRAASRRVLPAIAPDGHLPQLDGLRAVAAFAVLLHHTMPDSFGRLNSGAAGVRLFFVLSGFLITRILLRARDRATEQGQGLQPVFLAFYARRALRIFPLYYAAVLVAVALGFTEVRESLGWYLTFSANGDFARRGELVGPLGHFWSLAVEEQFYLLWPAVVLLTPRRLLLGVFVATLALGPLSRAMLVVYFNNPIGSSILTISCLDTLGAGALLALLRKQGGSSATSLDRWLGPGLWAGLALHATVSIMRYTKSAPLFQVIFTDTAMTLICAWLVDRSARGFAGIPGALLNAKPVVWLGTMTYGLYVYHNFILNAWLRHHVEPGLGQFLAVLAATILMASVSWRYFEKPLNDLKTRFPYVKAPTPRVDGLRRPEAIHAVSSRQI